jgi:cytochrome P450
VVLCSPEANELVFLNKDRTFSSELGWGQLLDRLFPRGLMLLDFDEHRLHRKALAVAFRPEPMARYFDELDAGIKAMMEHDGPVMVDCMVSKEANCFPMIPSGAAHTEMLLYGDQVAGTLDDEAKALV